MAKKQPVNDVRAFLMQQKRKTVTLDVMQTAFPRMGYESFRNEALALEQEGILVPVKASGTDHGGLARKYTIHAGPLFAGTARRIEQEALNGQISGALDLSWYLEHPYAEWQHDQPAIGRLSCYLKVHACLAKEPNTSLQQRSYDIFGDEKFLLTHGDLLKRLNLTRDALAIAPEADPLMMAFHPMPGPVHHHLIVENKAPWMALAPHLHETTFTSLILGYGWKICASIDSLPMQSGYPNDKHVTWYFGDFDWEGLRIWHTLTEQVSKQQNEQWNGSSANVASNVETTALRNVRIKLAVPFYTSFLSHPASLGKDQQQPAPEALDAFLSHVPTNERARFRDVLTTGHYYPQEALTPEELLNACKETLHNAT